MKALFVIFCLFFWGCLSLHAAGEVKKVVFISGKPSHGPMAHEHRAGNLLLAKRLNAAKLGVEAIVLPEDGYPEDPTVLKDAATIVIFCTGGRLHMLNKRQAEFDEIMKAGTGVVMIHWATETVDGSSSDKFLSWMGGHCALNWSVNPHWVPRFDKLPEHPITRGVKPFALNDEWYYHMRFVEKMKGVTPILSGVPGPETLKRPDGLRSGNPTVRKKVAAGEPMHVAWGYERPDGKGRGFGFTGGHHHVSWQDDNFRTIILNAILWTAKVDVPQKGVPSSTPSDAEMKQNLDAKKPRKPATKTPPAKPKAPPKPAAKPEAKAPPAKPARYAKFDPRLVDRGASSKLFKELREAQMVKLDSAKMLDLLTRTLGKTSDETTQKDLLRGIVQGLEGRRSVDSPEGWGALSAKLRNAPNGDVRKMVQQLDQVFGLEAASERALVQLMDTSLPDAERQTLLRTLVTQQNQTLKGLLPNLLNEAPMRIEAIRAFRTINDPGAPKLLLSLYADWKPPAKRAVVETLATRKNYAVALLARLKDGSLPKEDIAAHVARPLSSMLGTAFTDVFGDLDAISKDKAELMARYTKLLTSDNLAKADAARGRVVFTTSCFACHKLYGEGGVLGPDLTGSNRADLQYILLNMIEPSADIPTAYQLVTLHTKSGQIIGGTISQEDDQRVVLNMVGQTTTVLKSDISKREVSPMSMMPEGLLPTLKDAQVLDLVKYLQTTKQVGLPK